jgi:hypothetical protein
LKLANLFPLKEWYAGDMCTFIWKLVFINLIEANYIRAHVNFLWENRVHTYEPTIHLTRHHLAVGLNPLSRNNSVVLYILLRVLAIDPSRSQTSLAWYSPPSWTTPKSCTCSTIYMCISHAIAYRTTKMISVTFDRDWILHKLCWLFAYFLYFHHCFYFV